MIETSKDWCCEKCGKLIHGLCNNNDGVITHIGSCIENLDKSDIKKVEFFRDNSGRIKLNNKEVIDFKII